MAPARGRRRRGARRRPSASGAASPDADFPTVGRMTMSAGVCDISQAADADALYRLADGALYWAKHHGRDVVLRYSPGGRPSAVGPGAGGASRAPAGPGQHPRSWPASWTRRTPPRAATPSGSPRSARSSPTALGWSPERAALLRRRRPRARRGQDRRSGRDPLQTGTADARGARAGPGARRARRPDRRRGAHPGAGVLGEEPPRALGRRRVSCGLVAESIPEGARIMALADAWDVMTSERPYTGGPATPARALAECRVCAGTQFWPPAVEALIAIRGGTG